MESAQSRAFGEALFDENFEVRLNNHRSKVINDWIVRNDPPGVLHNSLLLYEKIRKDVEDVRHDSRFTDDQLLSRLGELLQDPALDGHYRCLLYHSALSDIEEITSDQRHTMSDDLRKSHVSYLIFRALLTKVPLVVFESTSQAPADYKSNLKPISPIGKAIQMSGTLQYLNTEYLVEEMVKCSINYLKLRGTNMQMINTDKEDFFNKVSSRYDRKFNVYSGAANKQMLSVLQLLLDEDYRFAANNNMVFSDALRKNNLGVVKLLLGKVESFRTADILEKAVKDDLADLVDLFLMLSPNFFTAQMARLMVEEDRRNVWQVKTVQTRCQALIKAELLRAKNIELKETTESRCRHNPESTQDLQARITKKTFESIETAIALELLHDAVKFQRVDIVKGLIELVPELLQQRDSTTRFPLWHNNNGQLGQLTTESQLSRSEIRRYIVEAVLKSAEITLQTMSDIFLGSKVYEVYLDLSAFDSKAHDFGVFVNALVDTETNPQHPFFRFQFESILRYATFPSLDSRCATRKTSSTDYVDHEEIFSALKWLREDKHVEKIVELNVLDRLDEPHDEERIATEAKLLGVEVLNWRCLDLSIPVLEPLKDTLRELHLYCSGKNIAIRHWLSSEGVKRLGTEDFPNFKKLHIHLIKDRTQRAEGLKTKLDGELTDLKHDLKRRYKRRNWMNGQDGNGQTEADRGIEADRQNGIDDPEVLIIEPEHWGHTMLLNPPEHLKDFAQVAVPKLAPFVNKYIRDSNFNSQRKSKVALLDNGVFAMDVTHYEEALHLPGLNLQADRGDNREGRMANGSDNGQRNQSPEERVMADRIVRGVSFVEEDGKESPWYFPLDPHGTQMANLICAIDPRCELFVARIAGRRSGITPEIVAKAIQWAIQQEVDIISMSFALQNKCKELDNVMKEARNHGIVLLCSTHDEGHNREAGWPAAYSADLGTGVIALAACDEHGTRLSNTQHGGYEYKLHGTNIWVGHVPYVNSTERDSGSSIATAIAAGLASLILSCCRYCQIDENDEPSWRKRAVEYFLNKMQRQNTNYVLLDKFCGIGKKDRGADSLVKDFFTGDYQAYVRQSRSPESLT